MKRSRRFGFSCSSPTSRWRSQNDSYGGIVTPHVLHRYFIAAGWGCRTSTRTCAQRRCPAAEPDPYSADGVRPAPVSVSPHTSSTTSPVTQSRRRVPASGPVLDAQPRLRTLGAKAQADTRPREDTMSETPTTVPTAPNTPRRWGDVPPPDDALEVQNLLQMYGFLVDQGRGQELGTLFVDDAEWDGTELGFGSARGRDDIVTLVIGHVDPARPDDAPARAARADRRRRRDPRRLLVHGDVLDRVAGPTPAAVLPLRGRVPAPRRRLAVRPAGAAAALPERLS